MILVVKNWLVFLTTINFKTIIGLSSDSNCFLENRKLSCKHNLPIVGYCKELTSLELLHITSDVLNLKEILNICPSIDNISVREGNILSVIPPSNENKIKVLTLTRLSIQNISFNFVKNFPSIEVLNLSGNRLTHLPRNFSTGSLKDLYLHNNTWNCSMDLEWVLNIDKNVVKDMDELVCKGIPHPGKPLVRIAQYLKDIRESCTPNCECSLPKVVQVISSKRLEPIVSVNCSNRGLIELPTQLPKYTRILHVEDNSINNLESLKNNPIYSSLWDLYLDNNEITSIRVLEGSHWLTQFRAFSLKGNKLAKLPSYVLDNALLKNPNMPIAVRLFLGGNPWRCDCSFIPAFQELVLQKYASQVKDIEDVKCSYVEGDENSLLPIAILSRSSVCRLPTEYSLQEGLNLLNVVLAGLIIFILGKLAYDYYHFKKTGRLPWIVTKMP